MFNNLSFPVISVRRATALWATTLVTGGLVAVLANPVQANPRFSRANYNSNQNFNFDRYRPNRSYPVAPAADYNLSQQQYDYNVEVPARTLIPVAIDQGQITLKKGQSRAVSLKTTTALRQADGVTVIPPGSQIIGQFRPIANGSAMQFVAQQLVLNNGQYIAIDARSRELVGFDTVNKGARASDVIKGTLAGAGTATLISGTTGDRRITPLEVLGGAAAGALAGWGLPAAGIVGGGTEELMTVTNRDLTLTLQSPLRLSSNQGPRRPSNRTWSTASW